jgi:aminoglycoside 3-N-acetyltransferase
MITYHDWTSALKELRIESHLPVLIHANPQLTYETRSGVHTCLSALMSVFDGIMIPAFTTRTMIIPHDGPADNAMVYGNGDVDNLQAEMFTKDMNVDTYLGKLPNLIRTLPEATRSKHPILSFTGIGVDAALAAQEIDDPYGPIRVLGDLNGWIILLGEDHRRNFTIHYAEFLLNRKQFLRWALTPEGILECPHMPGCPEGFNSIASAISGFCRQTRIGEYQVIAIPAGSLVQIACGVLRLDSNRLLCGIDSCSFCNVVRKTDGIPLGLV